MWLRARLLLAAALLLAACPAVSGPFGGGANRALLNIASPVVLQKLRADYPEVAIFQRVPGSNVEWVRWLFTNRYNGGAAGNPRMLRASIAKLYASTSIAPLAENLTTGTQAVSATATQGTSGGTKTGSWTSSATIGGVTDVVDSTTAADKISYTVAAAHRIVLREYENVANGGYLVVTVKVAGVEIDSSLYDVPLTSGERRIDLARETGQVLIAATEDLGGLDATVDLTVSASDPASGRGYSGGVQNFPVVSTTTGGRLGTWEARTVGSTASVPTASDPGAVVIYSCSACTSMAWNRGASSNAGQQDVHAYDAGGTEVGAGLYSIVSNQVDSYSTVAAVAPVTIFAGAARQQWFLVVRNKPSKNASSTAYRAYDDGAVAYDEGRPGKPTVDTFNVQGIDDTAALQGTVTALGTGNLGPTQEVFKPADNISTAGFAGGIHGFETSPSSVTYAARGATIDVAGAAVGTLWKLPSVTMSFATTRVFPSDGVTKYADVAFVQSVSGAGYHLEATTTYAVDTKVIEDYAMMLMVPNTASGTQGINSGFAIFGQAAPDASPQSFTAFDDSHHDQAAQVLTGVFYQAAPGYIVRGTLDNPAEIAAAHTDPVFAGARALSFVEDRSDKFVKLYDRAFSGSDSGVLVPAGHSYTAKDTWRVEKRTQ